MSIEGVHRPSVIEVSSSAIAHNVGVIRSVIGNKLLCGVVKANGYGHGAIVAANAAVAAGVDLLAVAIIDEGLELRAAGITLPILVLAEVEPDAVEDALRQSLTLTIGSPRSLQALAAAAGAVDGTHRVHVKVDTGMQRMGVAPEEVRETLALVEAMPNVVVEGIFSHFSVADGDSADDRAYTLAQAQRFNALIESLRSDGVCPSLTHVANSAGVLGHAELEHSIVRVGLALYGYAPSPWIEQLLSDRGLVLRPAMTVRSKVSVVRPGLAGDRPSYGRRHPLASDTTIATIPFGYADGFARKQFDAGATVLINGARFPLAGVVTMDQILIDCQGANIQPGDDVVLLGSQGDDHISAEEWASRLDTITWEVLCGLGERLPRRPVA